MDDIWEREHGLNLRMDDSSEDPEGDDLTDLQEFLNSTDPKNSDTDGDGYKDGEEVRKGYDPLDPKSQPDEKKIPALHCYSVHFNNNHHCSSSGIYMEKERLCGGNRRIVSETILFPLQ